MERLLTCIVCPRGCTLEVSLSEGGEVLGVVGNACKRGLKYAEDECTHPMRTVTSTVRCEDGKIVAVKTTDTVPKEKVFEVMREINLFRASPLVDIGEVIIENVAGVDGVGVVVTSPRR